MVAEPTILQSRVPPRLAGATLLGYLLTRFRYQSEAGWSERIGDGRVTVNGSRAGVDLRVRQGDVVAYAVELNEPAVDARIEIIHADPVFVVAIKPGQLPSHADGNFIRNTFIHLLTGMIPPRGEDDALRLVHRLDRETSGLMVVARDKAAHANLMSQFAAGTVGKEYLAIARGWVEQDTFEVAGWIGRDPASAVSVRHALFPAAVPGAKSSLTLFTRERDLPGATLLRCVPKTGRTNQIRVHLASIAHPVVGDKLYGRTDEEFLAFIRHVKAGGDAAYAGHAETPRQMLHAAGLSFAHPVTGVRLEFSAPVPADFAAYLDAEEGDVLK